MPYAPGVQYDASPLYRGLADAGHAIEHAREAEKQRQFLAQQLQQQQAYGYGIHADELAREYYGMTLQDKRATAGLDAQYGIHADELAKDYYSIEQQNARAKEANAPFSPPPDALNAAAASGYHYLPQSRHGGSYVPNKPVAPPAPALGADPTGTGDFFYDGKKLTQRRKPSGGKMDFGTQTELSAINTDIANTQEKMAKLAASGLDTPTGGFLGMFQHPAQKDFDGHATKLAGLLAKRSALLSQGGSAAPAPSAGAASAPAAPGGFYGAPAPTSAPGGYTAPPLPTGGGADAGSAALLPSSDFMATPRPRIGGPGAAPAPRVQTSAPAATPAPDALPNLNTAGTNGFKSADEVKAALRAGKIDRATAQQLLQEKFGFVP